MKLNQLDTEKVNQNSLHIDEMSTIDILKTINNEDQKVAFVVQDVILQIAQAVDCIYKKMCLGGRLIYVGAGTSGRLGILDASECPPTYGVEPTLIQGIIAGGIKAVTQAVEGAEDSKQLAQIDLEKIDLNDKDIVCGIAASGRTPYVIAGLQYARKIGCSTISLCCVQNGEISKYANYPIEVVVGPEVVTGSTRMKAGTAQKMVLNMISTSVMIKRGKVFGNLMVDVQPTNEKLKMRAVSIVCQSVDCDEAEATRLLNKSKFNVKIAILMGLTGKDEIECQEALEKKNIALISLTEQLNTSTPIGKFAFHLLCCIAEMERNIISERTIAGLTSAKAKGRIGGRKPGLTDQAKRKAKLAAIEYTKYLQNEIGTIDDVCRIVGVSRATLYKYLRIEGINIQGRKR